MADSLASEPPRGRGRGQDARILRDRAADLSDRLDRSLPAPTAGTARIAVKIFNGGSMPTTPEKFYLGHPVRFAGTECEGCADAGTVDGNATVPVMVLRGVPAVGDVLTAVAVGGRWVAEKTGCSTTICVTCSGVPVVGATVTITFKIGQVSGTTDSKGCVSLALQAAGSYQVDIVSVGNPDYSAIVTFKCDDKHAIEICSCVCSAGICVTGCGGGPITNATITVASLAPVSTDNTGCRSVCLDPLGGAGSYTVKVTAPGYQPYSNTRALACGKTIFVELQPTGTYAAEFQVNGCCGNPLAPPPLPGATVTVGGAAYTTDANGQVFLGITDPGTYPWIVSKARFASQSGSFTIAACGAVGAAITCNMAPAPGYHCAPQSNSGIATPVQLTDPAPDVLHGTDSQYGAFTLTYGTNTGSPGGGPGWYGFLIVQHPADCGCPAQQIRINYFMQSCPNGGGLAVTGQTAADHVHCTCFCLCDPALIYPNTFCGGGVNKGSGFTSDTLAPTIPFNYSMVAPVPQPCAAGTSGDRMYPNGATFTVTE